MLNYSKTIMPGLRNGRSSFGTAAILVVALFVLAASAQAGASVELPVVPGANQTAEFSGWVVFPSADDVQGVSLVISGSQVPGVFRTTSGTAEPTGAEIHLYVKYGGFVDWLYCVTRLSATSGELSEALPCTLVHPNGWLEGPSQFWLYIGYDPNGDHLGSWYWPVPELSIVTAHLVADQAVSTTVSTWGAVKSLFR